MSETSEREIRQVDIYGERPARAYVDGDWLIIAGVPLDPDDVEGWTEEDGHNCDQMGCGQDHVLYRVRLATPTEEADDAE